MICSIRQHLEIPEASHCPVLLHIACMHMHNMYIHISEGKPEVSYSAEFACSVYPQYAKDPGPRSQMFLTPLSSIHQNEQGTASNTVSRLRDLWASLFIFFSSKS